MWIKIKKSSLVEIKSSYLHNSSTIMYFSRFTLFVINFINSSSFLFIVFSALLSVIRCKFWIRLYLLSRGYTYISMEYFRRNTVYWWGNGNTRNRRSRLITRMQSGKVLGVRSRRQLFTQSPVNSKSTFRKQFSDRTGKTFLRKKLECADPSTSRYNQARGKLSRKVPGSWIKNEKLLL